MPSEAPDDRVFARQLDLAVGHIRADERPGIQSHTMEIGATVEIHVMRGVTFALDFQYFIRPNAQTNPHDAALAGFKTHFKLF